MCLTWCHLPDMPLIIHPLPLLMGDLIELPTPFFLTDPKVNELSGLVQSRRDPQVIWGHNDSLDQARIFAISPTGVVLSKHQVKGAKHVDWEDIAVADGVLEGLIFIGDMGNNFHWRDELTIYVVKEPNPHMDEDAELVGQYRFRYPQQKNRPPFLSEERCYDAEALFWAEGELYLIAKCFWGGRAPLYRFPLPAHERKRLLRREPQNQMISPITLEWVIDLEHGQTLPPFAWRVTAADYLPEKNVLAVLSYYGIAFYDWPLTQVKVGKPKISWIFPKHQAKQIEALTWLNDRKNISIMIGNEQQELRHISFP